MQIKEVANRLKITPRAIRFYEEKGLISPNKQDNNHYRTFTEKEVWRLQTIISLREAGMSIEDIKKALAEIDEEDKEELLYYLELQRSVMFSQWLEFKQIIDTTDQMIKLLTHQKSLALDNIYQLAEGSKRLRELRKNWHDKWNFDHRAITHDEYIVNNNHEFKNYEEALDMVVKWVSPMSNEKGLDIGTGTGNLAGKFVSKGIKMAGIDQSREMLKQCQRKFPDIETKLGNFLAIPFLDGQFDFVVTSFAFHHLTHEQQTLALEEMRRVLKPHGRICIVDLMFENKHKQAEYLQDLTYQGLNESVQSIQDEYYPILSDLLQWFDDKRYIAKHLQINDLLFIVYAVPI
jgi:putative AdoMet-dependent methyltransferase